MRYQLGNASKEVIQQLVYCLARSLLIYLGTPMVVAKLWKKEDIDTMEASIYRKTLKYANNIPNKSILNIMSSSRLAGEVAMSLAKGVWS